MNWKQQNKILLEKKEERAEITALLAIKNDKTEINEKIIYNKCKESFIYWADNFVWIQDPESEDSDKKEIPFLLYDFQETTAKAVILAISEQRDYLIEKSRKMGMSWLLMSILVWGWNFHKWEVLVGSQKAENVDKRGNIKSLLEKARYINTRQPKFLMPPLKEKVHDKYMQLIHPEHGAGLTGESNNVDFGRGDRRKVILFDEFASWDRTEKAAWQSCSSTTKCRIALSTPNTRGTNCHYYTLVKDFEKKNKPKSRLHWTLHPLYAELLTYDDNGNPTSPWYENEKRRASSPLEVSQELDINYEASMGDKVFGDFDIEKNVSETLEYDPDLPLYVAWDFGLDQTALLWIQVDNRKSKVYIIDEYANDGRRGGTDIFHYIDVVFSKPYKRAIHFGDPQSGENRSLTSGTSNANILRKHGLIFRSMRTRIPNRVAAARNIIGKTLVAEKCILTIDMFTSWQLVRPKTGNITSQIPEHNEHSHIGEAFTYFAVNFKESLSKEGTTRSKIFMPSASGVMA